MANRSSVALFVVVGVMSSACFGQRRTGGDGAGGAGGAGGEGGMAPEDATSTTATGETTPSACGLATSFSSECIACLEIACCVQMELCAGNPQCAELTNCVDDCDADNTCLQECASGHPAGRVDYLELAQCALDLCAGDCD